MLQPPPSCGILTQDAKGMFGQVKGGPGLYIASIDTARHTCNESCRGKGWVLELSYLLIHKRHTFVWTKGGGGYVRAR